MPASLSVLIGFQLLGEITHRVLHVPLPGPVIGMFLLAGMLLYRQRGTAATTGDPVADLPPTTPLARTANALIAHMGLLFVPAGVGIMTQGALLRHQWLPVIVGIIGSTLLTLVVTGLVFTHVDRKTGRLATGSTARASSRPTASVPASEPS